MKVTLCACAGILSYRACASPYGAYGAPRVRVKGSAHLAAHAERDRRDDRGNLVLAGSVVDDASRPIAGCEVRVSLERAGAGDHLKVAFFTTEPLALPRPCGGAVTPVRIEHGDTAVLTSDDTGRFCVRLGQPIDRYVARFEVAPSPFVDGASLALPVDLALPQVALRFDPEPSIVSLDGDVTVLDVLASFDDDGALSAAPGLPLVLANEKDATLGSATTDPSGRARFVVPDASLGEPGPGELRVRFAGRRDAAPAERAIRVERRTQVDLEALDAVGARLPPAAPEDGITVRIGVRARSAQRREAGAPTGSVEVYVGAGARLIAAAPIEHGEARVVVAFSAEDAEVPLRVRYAPDAPWFRSSGDLALVQPLKPPSPWRKAPLLLAAIAAFAWVAIARLPARALRGRAVPKKDRPPAPGEHVEVLRATEANEGWRGRVADVHEGTAVPAARVAIERRGFDGTEIVVETRSAGDGTFVLPALEMRPGADLVIEAPLHATLRRPLPPAGELSVSLVLRRRALLDRLVGWARRQGPPYDVQPEASPGHVRRAAGDDGPVARWADTLERTVYGPGAVDERAESEVEALAPGGREARRP